MTNTGMVIVLLAVVALYAVLGTFAYLENTRTSDYSTNCLHLGGFAVQGVGGKLGCLQKVK